MSSLLAELRRRNVFRVAGVYAVIGWLLVQVVVSVESPLHLPEWTDTLIIVLLGVGFPIAVILAWAFELTPDGVKLTPDLAAAGQSPPARANRLDYAIIAGIGLIALTIAFDRLMPAEARPAAPAAAPAAPGDDAGSGAATAPGKRGAPASPSASSIAVLPFADLSPAGDQEYFSDGMAEEILNVLARIDGLEVASRTSSFQFRSTAAGVPAIARELGVRHVLEGSVRKSGDAIRVTAQLIDAANDKHLWSDTFDATLSAQNIFAIQGEIANAIVAALREEIGVGIAQASPAPVHTSEVEAYELFLKARAMFQSRRDLGEADRLLERAIAIDPRFAEALAIRAAIHQFSGEYGTPVADERDARRTGRGFAAQALTIDPLNSNAHAITALSNFYDRLEGVGTVELVTIFADYARAIELDPRNANALNWQGLSYAFVGDNERAVAIHRRCIELDPALAACWSNLASELVSLGRREEGAAVLDGALDTGVLAVGPVQLLVLAELKRRDAFLVLALNASALKGLRKFNAFYDALSQPGGDDRAMAAELKALFETNKASARVRILLNALGDYSHPPLLIAHFMPILQDYRRSAEFRRHMQASGIADYWRAHGFPPQCRSVGAEDFTCD